MAGRSMAPRPPATEGHWVLAVPCYSQHYSIPSFASSPAPPPPHTCHAHPLTPPTHTHCSYEGTYEVNALVAGRGATGLSAFKPAKKGRVQVQA